MSAVCEADSDETVRRWHWAVFRRSLRLAFDGRTSPRTRGEIVRWMMSDRDGPFSFTICCRLEGVNPQAMRERFFERAKIGDQHSLALKEIPEFVFELHDLEFFSLINNELSEIPEKLFDQQPNLRVLNLASNGLTALPRGIGRLRWLEELYLWDNDIHTLPDTMNELPALRVVDLLNNAVARWPTYLQPLRQRLESLRLAERQVTG